jgi:hypothetical protein
LNRNQNRKNSYSSTRLVKNVAKSYQIKEQELGGFLSYKVGAQRITDVCQNVVNFQRNILVPKGYRKVWFLLDSGKENDLKLQLKQIFQRILYKNAVELAYKKQNFKNF